MNPKEFTVEFTYQNVYYRGLVRPFLEAGEVSYVVNLEDESQETSIQIVLRPSTSSLEDWDFECPDGGKADNRYDKDLLVEIGEQVEACLKDTVTGDDGMAF
jgi:hypothetical protein